jgi:hypothetical protein
MKTVFGRALNVRSMMRRIINARRRRRKEIRDQGANRKKVGSEIKDYETEKKEDKKRMEKIKKRK